MGKGLFVTDLDGTLLRDDRTLSKRDLDALGGLEASGVTRILATGRSEYSFSRLMASLGFTGSAGKSKKHLPVDYVIFSTGAGIMEYPGLSMVQATHLHGSDVVKAGSCFEKLGLDYMVHRPFPDSRYFLYRSRGDENPDFYTRLGLYESQCAPLDGMDALGRFGTATQLLAVLPVSGNMTRTLDQIRKSLAEYSVITATSPLDRMSVWVEVFSSGVSKSSAAAFLARRLGIARKNAVAVGNDYNDLDLLEWAGTGFVVENAPSGLKKCFETVPSNNRNGVCAAVMKCAW
ncbi:MAG: HAD hydrolase family protein [Desulfobacteraceae bacterium]